MNLSRWLILLCKIRNSEAKKEGFKNPPAGGVWGGMRAGKEPRQGESIPPDKLFRPAESVLIIWILLEIVSNFVQKTPQITKITHGWGAISFFGGKRGIRTLGTLRYTDFPGLPVKPLLHLSNSISIAILCKN